MAMPLVAALWGLAAGSALLFGAALGYLLPIPQRVVAAVMAFGSGVLVSALAFELMDEAVRHDGLWSTSIGFLAGGLAFTLANRQLCAWGARHRKRSGTQQPAAGEGAALAIALGAVLDGIPESVVIGVGLLEGGGVSLVTVAAVWLSNLPEGMSSAAGMRKAGRGAAYVFGLWGGITLLTGVAAMAGFTLFDGLPPAAVAATMAVAAGAILAMIADTMIPEAFEVTHDFTGLVTVAGFLCAFVLSRLAG
ncbi:ZIP family metal transporter [Marinimicrococcus flavescens]|uniref:ZIP family metal transporter n=1 Tax=Marinimicrococcus flavescens TaxID=3031815 RepID=UPI003898E175